MRAASNGAYTVVVHFRFCCLQREVDNHSGYLLWLTAISFASKCRTFGELEWSPTYLQVIVPIRFCLVKWKKADNLNPMIDMSYASKVPHTVNQNINDAKTTC